MSWLSQNLAVVFQILPGFITAGIFYAVTAHPKTSEFERVIQALIFTVLLKIAIPPLRWALFRVGEFIALGMWSADAELAWMSILAVPLGLVFVAMANMDLIHRFARRCKLTARNSYPSEWYSMFVRPPRWVILHLLEGRRLYGWPEQWPDHPDKGHFVIDQPEWVLDDGTQVPMPQINRLLIPATEVLRVEFLAHPDEIPMSLDELKQLQSPLLDLHRSVPDGSKAATASPESSNE